MKEEEINKLLRLMNNLINVSEVDTLSSQSTKDLIRNNISEMKQSIVFGEIKSLSEYGKSVTLGLGKNTGEFRLSREVMEAAHEIDRYFRTL